jgi:hypothetical protein
MLPTDERSGLRLDPFNAATATRASALELDGSDRANLHRHLDVGPEFLRWTLVEHPGEIIVVVQVEHLGGGDDAVTVGGAQRLIEQDSHELPFH